MSRANLPSAARAEENNTILRPTRYVPHAALVQSFRPTMCPKADIERRLKDATSAVEKELMAHYSSEQAMPVILKLRQLLAGLNYHTHKSSIAVFASPVAGKVAYLDIPVEDRIVVDQPFSIRDLVRGKKIDSRYLVMQLGSQWSRTYLGEGRRLQLIKSNASTNRAGAGAFLRQMEQGLGQLLQAYPLPTFILGTPSVTDRFAEISGQAGFIVDYLPADLPEANDRDLQYVLRPYLLDWHRVAQTFAIRVVENARLTGHLAIGLRDVESMAFRRQGHLLVVEKGYSEPGPVAADALPFYVRDSVDVVMQQVLENGGDVEFAEDGALEAYGRIALVLRPHPGRPVMPGLSRPPVSQQ